TGPSFPSPAGRGLGRGALCHDPQGPWRDCVGAGRSPSPLPSGATVSARGGALLVGRGSEELHMPRVLSSFLLLSWLLLLPRAAGHALPYHPAFYPQEIRLESVDPATAARRLQAHTLHAYLGGTPDFAGQLPSHVTAVASLKSYLVLTFDGE